MSRCAAILQRLVEWSSDPNLTPTLCSLHRLNKRPVSKVLSVHSLLVWVHLSWEKGGRWREGQEWGGGEGKRDEELLSALWDTYVGTRRPISSHHFIDFYQTCSLSKIRYSAGPLDLFTFLKANPDLFYLPKRGNGVQPWWLCVLVLCCSLSGGQRSLGWTQRREMRWDSPELVIATRADLLSRQICFDAFSRPL